MIRSQNEIENIFNSLDGIQRAVAKPFMHTRVQARLRNEEKNVWSKISAFIVRPVVAFATVIIILVLNYFIVKNDNAASQDSTTIVNSSNSASELLQNDSYILAVNNYETNPQQ